VTEVGSPNNRWTPSGQQGRAEWRLKIANWFSSGDGPAIHRYDLGDHWEHTVTLKKILPHDPEAAYPRCTGGRRACPSEDCLIRRK